MAFPHTYKNIIELTGENFKKKIPSTEKIVNLLTKKIKKTEARKLEKNDEKIFFITKNTLFRIEYKIKISVRKIDNDFNIEFEIGLEKLIKLILFSVIFIAFFSFLSVKKFLIFAGLFIIIFYSANLFFINSYVLKLIKDVIGGNIFDFEDSEILSKKQKEWIKNPNKCSGCGFDISNFDLYCPDCGLKLRKNRAVIPMDITKYHDKIIRYHYKEKKERN